MAEPAGVADGPYEAVVDVFGAALDRPGALGGAVAAVVDDDVVVDLRGGWADRARTIPWRSDTLVNVWSLTKLVSAIAVHRVAAAASVGLDDPLARWWPEVAVNGKRELTLRMVLAHRAGLAAWREPVGPADLVDRERLVAALAAQAPWWVPGSASGYHVVTFGYLLDEIVRRVDGRTLPELVATQLGGSERADLSVGVGPAADHRVAELVLTDAEPDEDRVARLHASHPVLHAASTNPELRDPAIAESVRWRRSSIPSANGHATAVALARLGAGVASGRIVDPDVLREPQPGGVDLVLGPSMDGESMQWGLGVGLNRTGELGPNPGAFGHGGYGGSLVVVDPEHRLGLAFVTNHMIGQPALDGRALDLVDAVYGSLLATTRPAWLR